MCLQALERERRAQQAQYVERDRQIALQQGRERCVYYFFFSI